MELNPSQGIAVFTDGSAYHVDRSGGWGWVAVDIDDRRRFSSGSASDTTISRMELTAPTEALNELADEFGACDLLVYSDSEYVVLGCNDTTRKRKKNADCWEALDEAINRHNVVVFEHVKGHSDSVYNEMADELAGGARRGLVVRDSQTS